MPQPRPPKREVSPSTSKRRQKAHVHAKRIIHLSRDTTTLRLYPHMYGRALPSLPLRPHRTSFPLSDCIDGNYDISFMPVVL